MPPLPEYGPAIVATTAAVRQIMQPADGSYSVTTRTPKLARAGVTGASVNLFLYRDELVEYRSGNDPSGAPTVVQERLHYLVTAFPPAAAAGAVDEAETVALLAYGRARSAVATVVATAVSLPSGDATWVTLQSGSLEIEPLTALWSASDSLLRLSFTVTATMVLPRARPFAGWRVVETVAEKLETERVVALVGPSAAAQVALASTVADDSGLSLRRVDLGSVVSRFIGETEQNLRALFDSAESGGAILLFDEADALFGKRSEVRDAHDRYAGVEPAEVIELMRQAPRGAIVPVTDAGPALLRIEGALVRFPPD